MTHDSPIMMSGPMVQACLRQIRGEPGGKTQTRRFSTSQWDNVERRVLDGEPVRLWVRETWAPLSALTHNDPGVQALADGRFYRADESTIDGDISRWTPARHMPRAASRLTLLDVTVRRERLGDISEEDARAEGIPGGDGMFQVCDGLPAFRSAYAAYASLWNSLHGPGSWGVDSEKEVMVIGFRPVLGNIGRIGGDA